MFMCLTADSHNAFVKRAMELEDEKLLSLDEYYRNKIGNSAEWQLHGIVMYEIHRRRQEKRMKLEIALWNTSRRGKVFEMIKNKFISLGWYSSKSNTALKDDSFFIKSLLKLLNFPVEKEISIMTLPRRQTPLVEL